MTGKTQVIKLKKSTAVRITDLVQTIPLIPIEQFEREKTYFEIIDVRTEKEHQLFNIGGKNIPIEKLQDQLNNISSVLQPVLVYCQSGKRSIEAARKIKKAFPNKKVFSLKDGLNNIPR